MPRKSNNTKKKPKQKKERSFAGGNGFDHSAQDSEYLNLLHRVEARDDAKEVLKIAKQIEKDPKSSS